MGLLGANTGEGEGEMARLLTKACSASLQVYSPSARVGDRNWNWEKKISCPTMGVSTTTNSTSTFKAAIRSAIASLAKGGTDDLIPG